MTKYKIIITHLSGKMKGKQVSYCKKNFESIKRIADEAIENGDIVEIKKIEVESVDFCDLVTNVIKEI